MEGARFRLGSTSYVYRGDLIHNAQNLASQVDDIELVLFDSPQASNIPDARTVARLADIAQAHAMTYTVHLPFDLPTSQSQRSETAARVADLIHLMTPLDPYAYIFHIQSMGAGEETWTEGAIKMVQSLLTLSIPPGQWVLENLESYSPEFLEPIFAEFPICRALDIGHLWKAGHDALSILDRWLPQTRVIHLHGMSDIDHQSLSVMPPELIDTILRHLQHWSGVLTLEVFEDDFFSSRDVLNKSLARVQL
jgi:sugar phosphate isomerase/epimerase